MEHGPSPELLNLIALLGAAVVAVPIFKRIGLGSVIGYLAAGVVIGPWGPVLGPINLRLFPDPESILGVAEFGVVMLLFIIGLELKLSRLWSLRHDIFELGLGQVVACVALIAAVGAVAGLAPPVALVAAMGMALSSTAMVIQFLDERGEAGTNHGRRIFAVLLLQDLAIVPFLAIVALLAPVHDTGGPPPLVQAGIAVAAVVGIWLAGRFLLNPLFRLLVAARAREIMTAAALLVVIGAAVVMQLGGLSMAMGAFLAGVVLSESTFRHQLEADIEPFRGILLGLFFLGVGMSLDLTLVARAWPVILGIVVVFMAVKAAGIYAVARAFRIGHADGLRLAFLLAGGGEFAFVLYGAAAGGRLIDDSTQALLTAAVVLSMALTPILGLALRFVLPKDRPSMDGIEEPHDLSGTALLIGFGRFGQVVSQALLARGTDVSIIDADTDMIRAAARFGFKIYYGDGTRLDVLRAAGAGRVQLIAVCVDQAEVATRIVELIQAEFGQAKLMVRSYDRGHSLALIRSGVTYQIRETFESAMAFGEVALRELGVDADQAAEIAVDLRRRDARRLEMQLAGNDLMAGRDLFRPQPAPLTEPKRPAQALSEETAMVADPPVDASAAEIAAEEA